jgi:hypothetical protein
MISRRYYPIQPTFYWHKHLLILPHIGSIAPLIIEPLEPFHFDSHIGTFDVLDKFLRPKPMDGGEGDVEGGAGVVGGLE